MVSVCVFPIRVRTWIFCYCSARPCTFPLEDERARRTVYDVSVARNLGISFGKRFRDTFRSARGIEYVGCALLTYVSVMGTARG